MKQRLTRIGEGIRPRPTAFLIIGASVGLLLCGLYLWSHRVVMKGFLAIEGTQTETDVLRVEDALRNSFLALSRTAGDWAGWDDTYDFMGGDNPGYVELNLPRESYESLDLDLVALVDPTGKLKYGAVFDTTTEEFSDLPPGFLSSLDPLWRLGETESVAGVVQVDAEAMLIGAWPILTSLGTGPARGTLLFARFLDRGEVDRLREETHISFSLWPAHSGGLPEAAAEALEKLSGSESVLVSPNGAGQVLGYKVLPGALPEHDFLVRVERSRTVVAQGLATLKYFGFSLVVLGLLVTLVAQVLVDRLLLSRIVQHQLEAQYQALAERSGILLAEPGTWRIVQVNAAAVRLTGMEEDELVGTTLHDLANGQGGEMDQTLNGVMASTGDFHDRQTWHRPGGGTIELEVGLHSIRIGGRRLLMVVGRDITERVQSETALRESEERYALASRGANDGLWDWDLRAGKIHLSDRWKAIIGYKPDAVGSDPKEWLGRIHQDERGPFEAALQRHLLGITPHLEHEHRLQYRDGTYRWVLCRGLAVRSDSGSVIRMAGSITDISQRKRAEQRLAHEALHDSLTGLPNRALFLDRLQRAIERNRRRPDLSFAVLFLDLDRFKVINDSLGHMAGDRLLVEVGKRLDRTVRAEDTVARFGGDEFAVLMEGAPDITAVMRFGERLQAALSGVISVSGHDVFSSASIGIALTAPRYRRAEELLRDADIAMYRAKEMGRAQQAVFDEELHALATHQLRRENELRRALDRREFTLVYQPIYRFQDRRVRGFEALIRWQHPSQGLLPPGDFIPLAEETGLIVPIGRWVFRAACEQLHTWLQIDPEISMSINLSNRQFSDPGLLDALVGVIAETRVPANRLILEITESFIVRNPDVAGSLMAQLKGLGVQLSLDDFGTGYSSLSYLDRFPLDALKIDRSFVSELSDNVERQAIVKAIVDLGHSLQMEVVAEGIESARQLDRLVSIGCGLGQGFLFTKAVAPEAARRILMAANGQEKSPQALAVPR